jgi:arylamine N-acetyltransferase
MSVAQRYLERLGAAPPQRLDYGSLSQLLEAHLRAIPFENVTSYLGTPVSIEPEDVFSKLLEGRRGGYCMEHSLLARTALGELGFDVEPTLARVFVNPTPDATPQSHQVVLVRISGVQYIYDPGFGGTTPNIPIEVRTDSEQASRYNTYRLRPIAECIGDTLPESKNAVDITLVLESWTGSAWVAMYGLTSGPVIQADVVAYNWFISTSPKSTFSHKLLAATWDGNNRVTGFCRNWKKRTEGNVEEGIINSVEDVDRWLVREMGLGLSQGQVAAVWDKLQHEQVL